MNANVYVCVGDREREGERGDKEGGGGEGEGGREVDLWE